MKKLITIWTCLSIVAVSFGQTKENNHIINAEAITPGSPLIIQYDYGTCYVNHERQITIEATQSDSLIVIMRKYMPIAYKGGKATRCSENEGNF